MKYLYAQTLCVMVCTVLSASGGVRADDVIIKPITSSGPEIALIWIEGAECLASSYVPLVSRIQALLPYQTWIGIPDFPLHTPEPLVLAKGIERVLKNMTAQGMQTSTHFFGAHSLGGAMIQDYVAGNPGMIKGQILTGSFLLRKYANETYPVPTLTIGGELDGLCRVTRIAENFYKYVSDVADPLKAVREFPVVVLPGVTHNQFSSGTPPSNVKKYDLKPEVSYEQAHQEIASVSSAFIELQMGNESGFPLLQKYVSNTSVFVKPIIESQLYEGSYHLHPPCNNNGFKEYPCTPGCACGSRWTEYAQAQLIDLPNATESVVATDEFHPVWQVVPRVHLPRIWNKCAAGAPSCVLNVSTVSQPSYAKLDKFDTGFYPTAAIEIRAKLVSRQAGWIAAGDRGAQFNATDGPSLCAFVNEKAYQWGLATAGSRSLSRFKQVGQPLVMGPDKNVVGGPAWIWQNLEFKNQTDNSVQVVSIAQKTSVDYPIKAAAGFHYCKLLSPARAIEWIYLDGLRAALHL